ncbi:MAG: phosphoribosylglycinamide formyltransferase [Halieaceae bacterium MED-G27]|mgnify:CR=1 FL=1|jgi:phosphoribosylglycinamide formyltransferase-1|nr:phosphoribosylglycinamide formyltransferase [Halieaceae bacterium]OUT64243.1 MAG: phosphoribosylglycinamide formyltransferase [Cellvibrionales bacterium TMED21]PDH38086.1 MAG: phosphoribosylglycinamide formyltransferase [Halieaceae bacterium MED-G27]|tara:strand:- start:13013 stop:13672 length:660 start_codon:yes stop_codon:yes gene_type:complete
MPGAERRIVILISGRGSNMEAILNACKSGSLHGTVAAVISNRPDAKGLSTASAAGIETKAIDHKAYESRDNFDRALADAIDSYRPDVLVLAGFMRILTEGFVAKFLGKMINVHPSLLPDYPGLNTHQRAIDNGDEEAGATVHYVTGELDGGPAILQGSVNILDNDTADALAARILPTEHQMLVTAVGWHLDGRLAHCESGAYLDNSRLPLRGVNWSTVT